MKLLAMYIMSKCGDKIYPEAVMIVLHPAAAHTRIQIQNPNVAKQQMQQEQLAVWKQLSTFSNEIP